MLKLLSFISLLGLALFLVLIDYSSALANDPGPLSVIMTPGGLLVIVGLGGVVLKVIGRKDDPNIKKNTRQAFKDLRGNGR